MATIVNAQNDVRFTDQLERALVAGSARKQDGMLAVMAGAGRRALGAFDAFMDVYAETRREANRRSAGHQRLQ